MKAVVYERYGAPEVLRIEDVSIPTPGPGQVLVRVAATSINLSDWETLLGTPAYSRIGGLRTPRRRTLGSDIAGRVEAVGDGVTAFKPGDDVYGDNLGLKGGFAEYAVAPASALAVKPARAQLRGGFYHPAGGTDRAAGHGGRRARQPGADQRCGRGLGLVRHPTRQAARRARHRSRQCRQARVHAIGGRRRRRRLPQPRLHPQRPALRPDPRPGRPSLDVRLPPGVGRGWPLPMRRWHDARRCCVPSRSASWSAARPDGAWECWR